MYKQQRTTIVAVSSACFRLFHLSSKSFMLVSFCIHASQLSCMCTSSYLIGNGWNNEEWVHITWDVRVDICMWKRTVNFKHGLHKKNIASQNIELLKCRSLVHIHLFLRLVLKSCQHKMFRVLLDRHVEDFNLFFEDHSNACNLSQLLITMDQKLYVHFAARWSHPSLLKGSATQAWTDFCIWNTATCNSKSLWLLYTGRNPSLVTRSFQE